MTLILAGLVAGFGDEIDNTVDTFHADRWFVAAGASGPFTAASPVTAADVARGAQTRGIGAAQPAVIFRHTAHDGSHEKQLNVIAAEPGGLLRPELAQGRQVA